MNYSAAYGKAKAFQELYDMFESADAMSQNIAKQIKNPDKNYEIGSSSSSGSKRG